MLKTCEQLAENLSISDAFEHIFCTVFGYVFLPGVLNRLFYKFFTALRNQIYPTIKLGVLYLLKGMLYTFSTAPTTTTYMFI